MKIEKPTFTTPRLNVFLVELIPMHQNMERLVFLGFRSDEDAPRVAVNAVIMPRIPANEALPDGFPPTVDWIETCVTARRVGLAREMVAGIKKHLGDELYMSGATEEGEAFCAKFEAAREPSGSVTP